MIEIDNDSGFCNGVTTAIRKAEEELRATNTTLYCLGDIVHNGRECERLKAMGLISVDKSELSNLYDTKLLLRAHGEPPSTYRQAEKQNIEIIDATCPVVLHLQKRIKTDYDADIGHKKQIVIYGKNGHAEVIGLVGQTEGNAIVIENLEDAQRLDFSRNIQLYSQTTKSLEGFGEVVDYIQSHMKDGADFNYFDTICRQVANRMPLIREFAEQHDVILFVCGKKSSNGKILFSECCSVNPRSHMIDGVSEIDNSWFDSASSVGICGATSTPKWLMEQCRDAIKRKMEKEEEMSGAKTDKTL